MSFRCILAFMILAFPAGMYAQSLGDVARETRAERQKSTNTHPRVITNDDLTPPESVSRAAKADTSADADQSGSSADTEAAASNSAENKTAKPEPKAAVKAVQQKTPDEERDEREKELTKRSEEINQRYRDKILKIQAQITSASNQLGRLLRDQAESTDEFRRTSGTSVTGEEYERQQEMFRNQIEFQKNSIANLNSQLEDAIEAARHAGVRHADEIHPE